MSYVHTILINTFFICLIKYDIFCCFVFVFLVVLSDSLEGIREKRKPKKEVTQWSPLIFEKYPQDLWLVAYFAGRHCIETRVALRFDLSSSTQFIQLIVCPAFHSLAQVIGIVLVVGNVRFSLGCPVHRGSCDLLYMGVHEVLTVLVPPSW